MPLYEVAILEHPEKKNGNLERLVGVQQVVARDEEAARAKALLATKDVNPDRVEVLVRPFVEG